MPKRTDIRKIMLIGSGPIIIGQACEFDYSTQACKALREEGYSVVLVNSNPATIMTDPDTAERVYIEPLTVPFLERIIERERPDALCPRSAAERPEPGRGPRGKGHPAQIRLRINRRQTRRHKKAEDRGLFKEAMQQLVWTFRTNQVVHSFEEARSFGEQVRYAAVIRPAFTLGGTGAGCFGNKMNSSTPSNTERMPAP